VQRYVARCTCVDRRFVFTDFCAAFARWRCVKASTGDRFFGAKFVFVFGVFGQALGYRHWARRQAGRDIGSDVRHGLAFDGFLVPFGEFAFGVDLEVGDPERDMAASLNERLFFCFFFARFVVFLEGPNFV